MQLLRSRPLASPARLTTLGALASVGFLFAPAFAWADPSPALDRFSFSVGAYNADPKFSASISSPYSGTLRTRDLEPGRVTMPRITADMLLGDSHGISFDYYRYKRDYFGSAAGSESFGGFGTVSALGNANINTKLEFAKLSYKWWLGSGNTVFGLGAGAAYYRIESSANALVAVNGRIGTVNEGGSDDAIAPMLEVGVRHAITPDLRLFADLSGVRKGGGRLSGNIYNASAGVEWFPVKNVGVVLAYGATEIDLERQNRTTETRLKVKMHGPSAFIKARF